MTLTELCSQFTVDANIVIYDITSNEAVTDFVRDNKKFCENIPVEEIEIDGDNIYIFCTFGELSKARIVYEAAQTLRSFCESKTTVEGCVKCMFFNKQDSLLNPCLLQSMPQDWNF